MTFLLDLIDVVWFVDNFGEPLQKLLDAIAALLQRLLNAGKAAEETPEATEEA